MEKCEALDLLRRAVLACMDAKIKIGARPVDWAGQVEIIADGVGLRDGRFVMREAAEVNDGNEEKRCMDG